MPPQATSRELDIGSWFDPAFADQRGGRRCTTCSRPRGDEIGVVIELKYYGHDERLEERVVEIVEAAGMQDDIMLMSLKLPGLEKACSVAP